jgi:hypothetical protein
VGVSTSVYIAIDYTAMTYSHANDAERSGVEQLSIYPSCVREEAWKSGSSLARMTDKCLLN